MKTAITLIGCGKMGSAMVKALSQTATLTLFDHSYAEAQMLAFETGNHAAKTLDEALKDTSMVIIAVKPQDLFSLVEQLKTKISPQQRIVSIVAGIGFECLKELFPNNPLLLMMPNLASRFGKGSIALAQDGSLDTHHMRIIEEIFQPLGSLHWINPALMGSITAFASSPAFILTWIEVMVEAGIKLGFDPELSLELSQEVIEGTLTLLKESGELPQALKWQITSPSGTTIAGLAAFEAANGRHAILQAFKAAYERTLELNPHTQNSKVHP